MSNRLPSKQSPPTTMSDILHNIATDEGMEKAAKLVMSSTIATFAVREAFAEEIRRNKVGGR